jgi:hypothetical protein
MTRNELGDVRGDTVWTKLVIPILRSARQFLQHSLGIDRAIGFTVLARSWTILSGALTVLLIARFLSRVEQGYYYTFSSLVSMQVVFELGFSFVILQLSAHERSRLKILPGGQLEGSDEAQSRLASVLQKSVRWYSVAAVLMGGVLVALGYRFFLTHKQTAGPLSWQIPWLCLVLAVIFTFQMDPVFSFLEGCGFVSQVARMRLTQAVAGTSLAWLVLTNHVGLFAPAAIVTGQAIAGFLFLFSNRHFLLPLLRRRTGHNKIAWRTEIWPFQWRMAVSFFCSYLIFPLFNPVLFAYRGAAEAGQMGMSLAMSSALGTVAYSWINTKASPFGGMIARRDFATLDRVFFRTLLQSSALLLVGDCMLLTALFEVEQHLPGLASRMLPLSMFTVLLAAVFLNHLLYSEALYLRSHKREPFLILSVVVSALTGACTVVTGRLWGAAGVTVGYFVTGGLMYLAGGTFMFVRCRKSWHSGMGETICISSTIEANDKPPGTAQPVLRNRQGADCPDFNED